LTAVGTRVTSTSTNRRRDVLLVLAPGAVILPIAVYK
jgi:hypothetical protein